MSVYISGMTNRFASKLGALGIHPSMVERAIESASQEHEIVLLDGRVKRLAPFVAVEETPRGRSLTSISLYRHDLMLAEGLKRIHAGAGPLDVDAETAFRGVLPEGCSPSPDQVEAVEKVLRGGGVSILSGGPGTGKSTISKAIINGLVAAGIRPIMGVSPTGKAARRLAETTGLECSTIHSALTLVESAIGPSEFEAKAILVDECFDYSQRILTENGWERIGPIVHQEKPVRVWSKGPDGQLELKPVIRWLKNPAPEALLKIDCSRSDSLRGARLIRCTEAHKIYTPSGKRRAGDLRVGDEVLVRGTGLTDEQRSILLGSLLGDGSLSGWSDGHARTSPQIVLVQGVDQSEYLEQKVLVLGDLASDVAPGASGYTGEESILRCSVRVTDETWDLASEMEEDGEHVSGRRRWRPTRAFLGRLDARAIAVWFMDNGSTTWVDAKEPWRNCQLHTERFSRSTQDLFVEFFARFGIEAVVRGGSNGLSWLAFNKRGSEALLDLIRPFVPACMAWKLKDYRADEPWAEWGPPAMQPEVCVGRVRSIESCAPERRWVYDLEVADHHNYVAGNVVVSNCSMLSTELGARLVSHVATGTRVIFVGDVDQLPSIDPGAVLRDLIAADCFSVARLTQVHRQDEFSLIPEVAKAINEGRAPDRIGGDCCFVECPDANALPLWVYQYLVETMPNYITSIRQQRGKTGVAVPGDIQIIAPMKKGPVGTMALNLFIQDKVTGQGTKEFDVPIRSSGGVQMSARAGDRVIHKKNDREMGVVNGEVGYVVDADPMGVETHSYANLAVKSEGTSAKHVLVVRYEDGAEEKHVAYTKAHARDLELAYAITVHCVAPRTLVMTEKGMQRIEDVASTGHVLTPGGMKPYTEVHRGPRTQMFRIRTRCGYTLDATGEHGLDVWRDGRYVREVASRLVVGDTLRLKLGWDGPSEAPAPPPPPAADVRSFSVRFPRALDEDVAEFLGLMVGDGTVFSRGIRLLKRHPEVVSRWVELVERLFGRTPKEVDVGDKKATCYELCSTPVASWLEAVGGMMPKAKAVPDCVLQAPLRIQAAFLRGLFEDGTASLREHIEWTNASTALVDDVQVMLLGQGIISARGRGVSSKGIDRRRYLYIYGQSVSLFAERIGFISKFKQDRAESWSFERCRYIIPQTPEQIDALPMTPKDRHNAKVSGGVTRSKAIAYGILSDDLMWHHDSIESIEIVEGRAFCLSVPDGHQFIQNGFSGWNSYQGSQSPGVILVLHPEHKAMLTRGIAYTGLTRAAECALIIGTSEAVGQAAARASDNNRRTRLAERLGENT